MALELGLYAGFANFADQHNLQDLDIIQSTQYGHQKLSTGLDLGLRAAFYPLSFLGVEGELGVIPTKTSTDDRSATVWTYRAHLVAQYPGYRLVPFVVLGLGGMTVKSHPDTLGTDADPAMHWGLGAKFAINEYVSARFDFRDNLMQKNMLLVGVEDGDLVQNTEFLLGVSFTLGRTPYQPTPPPVDSDGDGFFDPQDACPTQVGVAPNRLPSARGDRHRSRRHSRPERSLPARGRGRPATECHGWLPQQGLGRRRHFDPRRQVPHGKRDRARWLPDSRQGRRRHSG